MFTMKDLGIVLVGLKYNPPRSPLVARVTGHERRETKPAQGHSR
ncbi:hypothetical protein ES707_17653 [subsurface metagenome]